jgi:hypothetical protein
VKDLALSRRHLLAAAWGSGVVAAWEGRARAADTSPSPGSSTTPGSSTIPGSSATAGSSKGGAASKAGGETKQAGPPLPAIFSAVPESGALTFRIMREGLMIGTHALVFTPPGSAKRDPAKPKTLRLTVRIFTEVTAKLTPLTLYRFSARIEEHWDGNQLLGFTAESTENGIKRRVKAERGAGGSLWLENVFGRLAVPPEAIAATFWNPKCLEAPLIDPILGRLLDVTVADRGKERIEIANGSEIDVRHFALSGDFPADLWYVEQPARRWAGMTRPGGDGIPITYELL